MVVCSPVSCRCISVLASRFLEDVSHILQLLCARWAVYLPWHPGIRSVVPPFFVGRTGMACMWLETASEHPCAPYNCPTCTLPAGTYTFTLSAHTADDDVTAQTIADILVSFYNTEAGWSREEVFCSGASTGVAVPTLYGLRSGVPQGRCVRYAGGMDGIREGVAGLLGVSSGSTSR